MRAERRNNTLMKKMIKYFLIIIISMALLNTYSSFRFKSFYGNVYTMLTRLMDIYSISMQINTLHKDIYNYTNSGSMSYSEQDTDYIRNYDAEFEKLMKLIAHLREDTPGESYYMFGDIQNMVATFNEDSRAIIKAYDSHAKPVYITEAVSDLSKLKGYINDEVKNLLVEQLGETMSYYEKFLNDIGRQENLTYVIIALITAACVAVAVRFSREISRPIHQLVLRLMKVAKGEFEVQNVDIKTNDEINVLIDSFNVMTVRLKGLIEEIQAKADIEKELKEQQIQNLEMSNLLNQSELKFLQSQINPHFLYNTLNSISGLAMIEGAQETMKLIICISDILQYYLRKINENVTLMEEFKIVESYLHIQKVRFGDRIQFDLDFDEAAMGYYVPSMILQPFVENAVIHGLEPKEDKGRIQVKITDENGGILIRVEDDGIGMSEETLEQLFKMEPGIARSRTRGIGVSNVVRRLELKYGRNIVSIQSAKGKGTAVSILLPKAV